MHVIAFVALVICVFFVVVANLLVVQELYEKHKAAYEVLGRPSPFYFVGLQWMINQRYFRWLWSSEPPLGDPKLRRLVNATKLALLGFLAAFIWLTVAVLIAAKQA
jgi:hypothetical protein